jgi:suppressor for copper-sensitivity B
MQGIFCATKTLCSRIKSYLVTGFGKKNPCAIGGSTYILGIMGILFCALTLWAVEPKAHNPVSVHWENPRWTSATHVRMNLVIDLAAGWKIYAPQLAEGEVGQPTTFSWDKSDNVWHIDAHWPAAMVGNNTRLRSKISGKTLIIPMDIALKERLPAHVRMVVSGLACSEVCKPFVIVLPTYDLHPPAISWSGWWTMVWLAFLGGAVLNIMPCVLPVLALKLRGLSSKTQGLFRIECLATAGGILAGFWFLALLTIILKTVFQQHVGWGMHFQNPYFVAGTVILMMVSGCGLLGVFHINTPAWAGAMLQGGRGHSVVLQAFLSGLLAVFLATPCSAPFLGTSLGFALTGQGGEIILFYTAIAMGFSLPYFLALIFPIAKILPKPGPWMVTFEKILGFLLMVSAGWFVITSLTGLLGVPWDRVALCIWALWMVLPLLAQFNGIIKRPMAYAVLIYGFPVVCALTLLVLPSLPGPIEHPISMKDGAISWQVFSANALEAHINGGKTIVVDFTGMGCPLCMVNKAVFKNEKIQKLLTQKDVVCLRGDFTRAPESLMLFLRKYGRSAIPFNLVISAKCPKGVVLSERLTVAAVQDALVLCSAKPYKGEFRAGLR